MVLFRYISATVVSGTLACMGQRPLAFDVSTVVVGPQKLETSWAYASGKWSDSGPDVGVNSTEIHCYKRFGFCEVASASASAKLAEVNLTSFDILRWDATEIIAVDSSPICVVNTLRFDFAAKKVTIGSTSHPSKLAFGHFSVVGEQGWRKLR